MIGGERWVVIVLESCLDQLTHSLSAPLTHLQHTISGLKYSVKTTKINFLQHLQIVHYKSHIHKLGRNKTFL
jgi:hypothetical protein